jgi:hypothetical protein
VDEADEPDLLGDFSNPNALAREHFAEIDSGVRCKCVHELNKG